jgi:hypothetical protein
MRIAVAIEATPKKSFATAVDWPGWSRSGKTEALALEALVSYARRYVPVARLAGEGLPTTGLEFEIVERTEGNGGTEFGVPSRVTDHDRRAVASADADRLARVVDAAWTTFRSVAEGAPDELRKGPRGGGRDTPKILFHIAEADIAYGREMGLPLKAAADDDAAVDTIRRAMLGLLRQPADGSPIAGRRWTTRYAAHRIAWHALDHAWEIEDRTEPAG